MNKTTKYAVLIGVLAVFGAYTTSVYSQDDGKSGLHIPSINQLAEKLDVDENELNEIVEEIREEHRNEIQAERSELILQAIEDGKLTEKQVEILDALEDLRPMGKGMFGVSKGYSYEQREEMRNQMREERENSMLETLNEQGLNVTHEEMQELKELRIELGIGGGHMHGRGRNI
jgi:1,2-phenylacetyl-CoA epoxidase catalytic subunit